MTDSTGCYHDSPTEMETYTGGRFDLQNPRAGDIRSRDIAHHLANIGRYHGAGKRFLSVAAHSIFCHDEAERRGEARLICLKCLVHDGHEAYTNDLSRPIRMCDGMRWYNRQCDKIQKMVYEKFGVDDDSLEFKGIWSMGDVAVRNKIVKEIDNAVMAYEVPRLMRSKGKDWHGLDKIAPARIGWFKWWWFRKPRRAERGFIRRLKRYGVIV